MGKLNDFIAIDNVTFEFDGEIEFCDEDTLFDENLEKWEEDKSKEALEYACLVNKNGKILKEKKSINQEPIVLDNCRGYSFMLHTHPRQIFGKLGGTFSKIDLESFANNKYLKMVRATAVEGTYVIIKKENFDKNGFIDMLSTAQERIREKFRKLDNDVYIIIVKYRTDLEHAFREYIKGFNTIMIWLHNFYMKNAIKYGYDYRLERSENG